MASAQIATAITSTKSQGRLVAQEPVSFAGVHLMRLGEHVVVKVEIDGRWVEGAALRDRGATIGGRRPGRELLAGSRTTPHQHSRSAARLRQTRAGAPPRSMRPGAPRRRRASAKFAEDEARSHDPSVTPWHSRSLRRSWRSIDIPRRRTSAGSPVCPCQAGARPVSQPPAPDGYEPVILTKARPYAGFPT
jgi:hypothetical protein